MKKTLPLLTLAVMLFSPALLVAQNDTLPASFKGLLDRAGLNFIFPEGLAPVPCIENAQMNYEYALKDPAHNFEVRYAIRPLDSTMVQYREDVKNGAKVIDPNRWCDAVFKATVLNIGLGGPNSGELPDISNFPPEAVREEFGADWGAVAFVMLGPEFGGTTYKYCLAMTIHRDNLGDAYIFYLSDDNQTMSAMMEKPFHALKFR